MQDAIQLARLDGAGSETALRWFDSLCKLHSTKGKSTEQQMSDFAASCLEHDKAAKTRFADIYAAFADWWRTVGNGRLPGTKTLATYLSMFYERKKSSVSVYQGVRLKCCLT